MKPVRRKWLLFALAALLASAFGALWFGVDGVRVGEAVAVMAHPQPDADPIRCHVVVLTAEERLAAVAKRADTWGRHALRHVAPPVNNPLLMNEDYAVARVENVSAKAVDAYEVEGRLVPRGSFGYVYTKVEDERGERAEFGSKSRESPGVLVVGGPNGATVRLQPGQVTWHRFRLLGRADLDHDVRPGTYTVRPVFFYSEASSGEGRHVPMEPLRVRITQRDIDEWRFWMP